MSKSTNTVVYFDWKTVIYIYGIFKLFLLRKVKPNLKWEMIKSDIRGETIKYSSKNAKINKVKTINIERELTELQNKKQASNREEIEKRINLLENELKTIYEKKMY
jgi:hypothetical protein